MEINLGPCCACEDAGPTVRNVIALTKKAPVAGRGWGCLICSLPADGAFAVVCDACFETRRELKYACCGYATSGERIPIGELTGVHEHNVALHLAYERMRHAPHN